MTTKAVYLCDRKQCGEKCSYPTCKHTFNIEHAVNFERQDFGRNVYYVEKEKTDDDNQ